MKIIVVGLGSMGRRRIRLLKRISNEFEIVGVDNQRDRCSKISSEFGIVVKTELENALREFQPNVAVVSTSPLSHATIIKKCLENGCHVFTELNLVSDGYEDNIQYAQDNNLKLFLSSTFLYRKEIEYIKNKIVLQKEMLNYIYHVGQYLPDWHPWEKPSDFFVSNKRTNGCRELMAIEFPWLSEVFGKIEDFTKISGKMLNFKLGYDDNYLIMLQHEGGNKGLLAVDVCSRKAVRNLEIFGRELYITWNGTPDSLRSMDMDTKDMLNIEMFENENDKNYASFIIENAYEKELRVFLEYINGGVVPRYDFEKDKSILGLIDRIEEV